MMHVNPFNEIEIFTDCKDQKEKPPAITNGFKICIENLYCFFPIPPPSSGFLQHLGSDL